MLERIIRQKQDRIAYKINESVLGYAELVEKAARYGELLKKQGVNPVMLYGHKDIDMFLSVFACIHAGRAYVPVDLGTPVARMHAIARCAKCDLILTNEQVQMPGVAVASLKELEKYSALPVRAIQNDIAYIIFTSGSTGDPKGVPITYSNLLHFVQWINALEPLKSYTNINVLNQASFSFDLSVADIFYAVSNGHTLVALDKESQKDFHRIFQVIYNNDVNVLVVTPTFMKLCMVNPDFHARNFPSIKTVYFCGEQLEVKMVRGLFERFPDVHVINAYGPTEATSAVSAIAITKEMLDGDLLPCGDVRTFATEIEIVNGEIVLKGKSVFGGYLGERDDGLDRAHTVHCFRTGDIGFIKDDKLYCKGRKDTQIKYKGYRIELTDIENNIDKMNGVKQCAVVAKYQDAFTVKMIKAYVVLEKGCDVDLVRDFLKKRIPAYMIPKQIIEMDALPVNENGKIDRKRLGEL